MSKPPSTQSRNHGGIVHTYQKYDPVKLPGPSQPPPDVVSGAFEHALMYGQMRKLTPEELARAVKLDPSQIQGFGPSLDAIKAMLEERKRKILATYETKTVLKKAAKQVAGESRGVKPPKKLSKRYYQAIKEQQIYDLERLWYAADHEFPDFATQLLHVMQAMGDKYQIDVLASKYDFTGNQSMTIPEALEIKEELERIDELLKQIEEASENAQIGIIDMEALEEFAEPGQMEQLREMQKMVEEYLKEAAKAQGLDMDEGGAFQLTPQAYKVFQGKLLSRIFSDLQASKTGRHDGPIVGEGSVEMQQTKQYEFGDSLTHMDITQSVINSLLHAEEGEPLRLRSDDIEVHKTRNSPKCATVVVMDCSGSTRYDGQYISVKRMALALDGLVRSEFPGDYLQFVEMATFAKPKTRGEIIELMPKPVTIHDPVVQLKVDMSRDDVSEIMIPPHFTNIQHGLSQARKLLANQDTPNKQVILITDGLPTAHFDENWLYMLYPPHHLTEDATLREGMFCKRDDITINIFLLPSWSQTEEDVKFAQTLAESTQGRVFFTANDNLDRFVVWDYVNRKREIIG